MRKTTLLLPLALFACTPTTSNPPGPDGGGSSVDLDRLVAGGDCPSAQGAGVDHATDITADETWRAADGPHRVTRNVRVLATLTVEPCATVLVSDGVRIDVGAAPKAGKLIALGTASGGLKPVRFMAADAGKPWGAIVLDSTGAAELSVTALIDGASPAAAQNGGGALRAYGVSPKSTEDPAITASLKANDLLVERPGDLGVNLQRYAGFAPGSTHVEVRGAKQAPLRLELAAAGTLPKVTLSGNARDEIELDSSANIPTTTIPKAGAPYRVLRALVIGSAVDGQVATLTVQSGVTLRFDDATNDSGITLGASPTRQGVIVAKGTASEPITFTSAKDAPAPGDWAGLYFRDTPTSGNAIENAVIEYGGAPSGAQGYCCGDAANDASILLFERPADAFVRNVRFRRGAGDTGIVLGWKSDEDGPDFKATNTFEEMPTCAVSHWRRMDGSCPNGQPECL